MKLNTPPLPKGRLGGVDNNSFVLGNYKMRKELSTTPSPSFSRRGINIRRTSVNNGDSLNIPG